MPRLAVFAVLIMSCAAQQSSSQSQQSPSPSPSVTLQSISAQPADLRSGFVVCSWSGDFAAWSAKVKPTASGYAQQMLGFWQRLQSDGASSGWVQDLSTSEDACQGFYGGTAGLVAHVTSIVVSFNSKTAATNAYQTGLAADGLFTPSSDGGGQTVTGSSTGLGPNSTVVTPSRGPSLVAEWQHGGYYMVVVANGIAPGEASAAVAKIDNRVP